MTVNGYSVVELFQCYAAMEAFSLYVVKKYPEDVEFLGLVIENKGYYRKRILRNLRQLENMFSIMTSIDLCNFGRKFLLDIFEV